MAPPRELLKSVCARQRGKEPSPPSAGCHGGVKVACHKKYLSQPWSLSLAQIYSPGVELARKSFGSTVFDFGLGWNDKTER